MSSPARRLAAIDRALPLSPELEALCDCLASACDLPAFELRAEALRLSRRYAGMTTEATIASVAAELDIEPAQLRADLDAIATKAAVCLG